MSPIPDLVAALASWLLSSAAQATVVVTLLLLLERAPGLRPLRTGLVTLAMLKLATPPWIAWAAPEAGAGIARTLAASAPPPALAVAIVLAWALGSVVALARLVAMRVRLQRTIDRAAPCEDDDALNALARAADRLRLRATPRLLVTAEAAAPYTAGARGPCIVLPSSWTGELSRSDLEAVLLHEGCHVRRRDPLRLELAAALGVLWWWNPAFHWANARWRASIEDACDDLVLELRDLGPADYCGALLRAARLAARSSVAEESFAGAAGMASGAMERRVRRLMGPGAARSRGRAAIAFVSVALLAALALPYVGPLAAPADSARHAVVHAWKHRVAHPHSHAHSHP